MPMHDPPHPGQSLREDILPAINMSISALALINGHAGISAELAYRLELAGLGNARMWLAMQAAYDLWQAEHRDHPPIKRLTLCHQ